MQHRTRIKICGIMRVEDALAAADAGADAIGMVLHANAPRRIELSRAKEIVSRLPPFVTPVGVFVDAPADLIRQFARELNLIHVQLHGNESPQLVRELSNLRVIKAIKPDDEFSRWTNSSNLAGVIVENGAGSGIENDWDAIAKIQTVHELFRQARLIAAGGLREDNVASVIALLRPFAVDVSTGVEESLGSKSPQKMRKFCAAVHAADGVR